jgi:hypothetical protein
MMRDLILIYRTRNRQFKIDMRMLKVIRIICSLLKK